MGIGPAKPQNKTPDEIADRLRNTVDLKLESTGGLDAIDWDAVFNIPDSVGVGKFPIFLPGLEIFF